VDYLEILTTAGPPKKVETKVSYVSAMKVMDVMGYTNVAQMEAVVNTWKVADALCQEARRILEPGPGRTGPVPGSLSESSNGPRF